ncbi:MAG: hypothetical protein IT467_00425 [Dokdonella sp.]|nr:hypothetical protein [Dokdonella sp.]
MLTFWGVVVSAVAGLISGGIASLIAPWVQWSIEKRRQLSTERRNKLKAWRGYLGAVYRDQQQFQDSVEFSEMRPHLSEKTRAAIEGRQITVRVGRGGDVVKGLILDDLAELERKWDLL